MDVTVSRQGSDDAEDGAADSSRGSHLPTNLKENPAVNINVVYQRRRVNPESLALRLGPELVRDLDALIVPGNMEMPSFAVRKTLQERYNIDRRHIYDYFHSRGLRVVKEDKNGNPVLPKEAGPAPLPHLRPLRQAPPRSLPRSIATDTKSNVSKPRGLTKAKPGRPRKHPIAKAPTPPSEPISSSTTAEYRPPSPTYYTVNPLVLQDPPPVLSGEDYAAFNFVINPLDESFSLTRAIGDITYSYRHKPVFDRMFELNRHPLTFASDQSVPSNEETSPRSASDRGLLLPHVDALSSHERQAIYRSLSESIGPASGIQESEGTYRKHMENRTKLYFEGLLSAPFQYPQTTTNLHRTSTFVTNEFRFWLSSTEVLRRNMTHALPKDKHELKPDAIGQCTVSYGDKNCAIPDNFLGQTLDDLFPSSSQDSIARLDIMDSPVIRARAPDYATRHFAHPEEGSFGHGGEAVNPPKVPAFSPTSDSTTSAPLARLATELPQSHIEFQGVNDFPDPVGPSIPAVEIEGHPKSEHPSSPFVRGLRNTRKSQAHVRMRLTPCTPFGAQVRERDRVRARSITSRGSRRRTTSAAGNI
ncbi:hypothetical protein F5I97DRAFT_1221579 [Phlebopus sp. FC_14]|nr:hypothetical protein F5I97DRAFT_1221579 [Phlebopus sp. FC_14]